MSRQLPPKPHLDVLKKQARQLLNDHQSGSSEAVARVSAVAADLPPAAAESFTLRDAQQVIAREYEFTSWQALVDHVGHAAGEDSPSTELPSFYNNLASDLVTARLEGHVSSFGRLGEEFDRRMGAAPTGAAGDGADPALENARLAVAALNDCDTWEALSRTWEATRLPALVNLEQLQSFERLHSEFARLMGARFAALEGVGRPVEAGIAFVDRTSYGEFVVSLARPTCAFRCSMDGLDGDLVLDLGPLLVDALVPAGQGDRDAQLARIAEGMVRDLEQVWRPVARLRGTRIAPHSDPFAMGVAPMYETCVLIAFSMAGTPSEEGLPGILEICYPASSIRGMLDSIVARAPDNPH